ncbi:hypothetical protein M0D21_15220 [Aquimarina sp. D1M17]|uniref:hypothetical protein n=1 Tax=Aquimarina acroporae TaxID=2937283 RepID=UPI0020C113F4|nr:hypothetical protein [Aquimarina acroporae]MCK8522927.1 hypothetical protein [Aquimarina acroporae]
MTQSNALISIFILYILTTASITAQTKFEKEYRIHEKDAPTKALNFVSDSFIDSKIKWYQEESHEGKTIEAKTLFNKVRHSIEFDTLGNLIDVERTIKFSDLASLLQEKISTSLKKEFSNFKISKTQIQWKASSRQTLISLINNQYTNEVYTQNYEIVLKGKKNKTYANYEVLLDQEGVIVKVLEILPRNTDNLEF